MKKQKLFTKDEVIITAKQLNRHYVISFINSFLLFLGFLALYCLFRLALPPDEMKIAACWTMKMLSLVSFASFLSFLSFWFSMLKFLRNFNQRFERYTNFQEKLPPFLGLAIRVRRSALQRKNKK